MKNKTYLFLLIISFLFTSCENNSNKVSNELKNSENNSNKISNELKNSDNITAPTQPQQVKAKILSKNHLLNFTSLDKEPTTLEIKGNIYDFSNILQPIVLVNFFSTWCPPCRGQIPHLNNLQKKYRDKLFMMGILIHNDLENKEVKNCISLKRVDYYISQSKESNEKFAKIVATQLRLKPDFELPMMIMFVYGEYYTHYEGTVPEEMIESDIKQALNEI